MRRNYNGFLFYKHTDKEVLVYFPTHRSPLRGVSPKSGVRRLIWWGLSRERVLTDEQRFSIDGAWDRIHARLLAEKGRRRPREPRRIAI